MDPPIAVQLETVISDLRSAHVEYTSLANEMARGDGPRTRKQQEELLTAIRTRLRTLDQKLAGLQRRLEKP